MFNQHETDLLAGMLRIRVQVLEDMLADQIQTLPIGDDSWADTTEQLHTCRSALLKVRYGKGMP